MKQSEKTTPEAWNITGFSLGLEYSIIYDDLKHLQAMAIMATEEDEETAEEIARACYHIEKAIDKAYQYDKMREKHAQTARNNAKRMTKAQRMARSQKANEAKRAKAEARKNGHLQGR